MTRHLSIIARPLVVPSALLRQRVILDHRLLEEETVVDIVSPTAGIEEPALLPEGDRYRGVRVRRPGLLACRFRWPRRTCSVKVSTVNPSAARSSPRGRASRSLEIRR
jgi:hypothetical protein